MTRLPDAPSQVIQRDNVLRFTFDGQTFSAYEGDTIASALAAAGVMTFSRSFKYHRRRGLLCVAGRCPNCLVRVGDRAQRAGVSYARYSRDGGELTERVAVAPTRRDEFVAARGPLPAGWVLLQNVYAPQGAVAHLRADHPAGGGFGAGRSGIQAASPGESVPTRRRGRDRRWSGGLERGAGCRPGGRAGDRARGGVRAGRSFTLDANRRLRTSAAGECRDSDRYDRHRYL